MTEPSLAAAVQEIGMAEVAVEALLADAREFKSPWIDVTKRANVVSNFDRHYHECWCSQHARAAPRLALFSAGRGRSRGLVHPFEVGPVARNVVLFEVTI